MRAEPWMDRDERASLQKMRDRIRHMEFEESELVKRLESALSEGAAKIKRLTTENEKLTKALTTIAVYYETEYREGDKAYQAAIMAREAIRHEQ